jgi:caffeoyl-CoA O-methyltransferase
MRSLLLDGLSDYVFDHTTPEPELFERLRTETHAQLTDPQMQVGRVEGTFLRLVVQLCGARNVIEVGTFSGYSALAMASGLPKEGKLVTCDIDPVAAAMARRYFAESPHGHKIDFRLGPALETIASLAREGTTFDLAFIDADKTAYVDYYEAILAMMPSGAVILADNALWSGSVLRPESADARALARFNDHVQADARVDNVLLSVRDGIMMARKR